jgi:hypothetical protein
MVGNAFNDVGAEPFTIFLSVHEEGASQQFLWVNDNCVVSSGRTFRWVRCGFRIRMFISSDKICMMATRIACNRAIESSYWRMDNNSDVG